MTMDKRDKRDRPTFDKEWRDAHLEWSERIRGQLMLTGTNDTKFCSLYDQREYSVFLDAENGLMWHDLTGKKSTPCIRMESLHANRHFAFARRGCHNDRNG